MNTTPARPRFGAVCETCNLDDRVEDPTCFPIGRHLSPRNDGWIANYCCPRCGRYWVCWWSYAAPRLGYA